MTFTSELDLIQLNFKLKFNINVFVPRINSNLMALEHLKKNARVDFSTIEVYCIVLEL